MTTLAEAKAKVEYVFATHVAGSPTVSFIPARAAAGKVYEVVVLSYVIRQLRVAETFSFRWMSGGSRVVLKTGGGSINKAYPYVAVYDQGMHVANIFTDVDFSTLSSIIGSGTPSSPGYFHEMDILVVDAMATGKPAPSEIWLGVECKHTPYGKNFLREALGVRRELSFVRPPESTRFRKWPRTNVPASPSSCLLVCSTDSTIRRFDAPGAIFGIDFRHVPL